MLDSRRIELSPDFVRGSPQPGTTIQAVLDSNVKHDSAWRSREFEAQMLVEVLRLSRLTVLYGAEGAGKTTLLKTGVLPLLRGRADDRLAQDQTGAIAPSPDRQSEDRAMDRGPDVAIVFDRWETAPLAALRSQICDALRSNAPHLAEPHPELADSLAAWNKALGVRFFIILDGFEQYLCAPFDRAGIADFDEELVRLINAPGPEIHFLLSIRDDAEALLRRFRGRICGLDDAFLRLPRMQSVAGLTLRSSVHTDGPTIAATPPAAGAETLPVRPNEPSKPPVRPATSAVEPAPEAVASVADWSGPPQLNGARQSAIDDGPVRGAATGAIVRAPRRQHALRRSVRRFVRISLAPVVAGLVIGAGAGYFTVSQNHPAWQAASSPNSSGVVTEPAADPSPAPVIPAIRADPPAPSPPQERIPTVHSFVSPSDATPVPGTPVTRMDSPAPSPPPERPSAVHRAISRPGSPTPIKNAKGTAATREVAARIAPSAVVGDWRTEMQRELNVCRHERFFPRVMCTERVRWKHCAPGRWNRSPECATGIIQMTSSD